VAGAVERMDKISILSTLSFVRPLGLSICGLRLPARKDKKMKTTTVLKGELISHLIIRTVGSHNHQNGSFPLALISHDQQGSWRGRSSGKPPESGEEMLKGLCNYPIRRLVFRWPIRARHNGSPSEIHIAPRCPVACKDLRSFRRGQVQLYML